MAEFRILLVEDEPVIAAGIEAKLTQLGYTVVGSTASGENAIKLANTLTPDLILMDIRLRGRIDGVKAAAAIRRDHETPVVFLTAYADEATLVRATEQDPFGYVVKPFTDRELFGAIEVTRHRYALERELKNREQRYRMLAEVLSDFAFGIELGTDPEDDVLVWSVGLASSVFGDSFTSFGGLVDILHVVHPDHIPAIRDAFGRLRSGERVQLEFRVLPPEGSRWVKMDAHVRQSGEGKPPFLYAACQDITALRHVERRLEQRDLGFRQIVQTLRQGIWVGDTNSVCIYANQALCDMTGLTSEQMVGRTSLADLIGSAADLDLDEPFEAELSTVSAGRTAVLVNSRVSRDEQGDVHGRFCLFVDVSAQKRAIELASRSQKKLRGAFRATPRPGILVDAATNVVIDVNEAFIDVVGFSREEIAGSGAYALIDYRNLDELNRFVGLLTRRTPDSEVGILTKSGETRRFHLEARTVAVEDEMVLLLILEPL
jgi:PAS domain S-box-containing protein